METRARSNRLYFKSEPLGTITIDSALPPDAVIQNLEAHGREWRESAIPKDLRKFSNTLGVQTRGTEFKMKWLGGRFSPVCFGIVQPHETGSRIRAGFQLDPDERVDLFLTTLLVLSLVIIEGGGFYWALLGFVGLAWIYSGVAIVRRRSGEPMRTRLVEALNSAAKEPWKYNSPFATMPSTDRPLTSR